MTWKAIEFQGIVKLDQSLVDQLGSYLQEKESQLGNSILHAIHTLPRESLPPVLPFSTSGVIKVSEAVEAFGKNVRKITGSPKQIVPSNDWEVAARQINSALWEYVEVLEGCVTELFQQLGQVGFEEWDRDLIGVVDTVKEMLSQRLEDLRWKVRRLEELLWKYRIACESQEGKRTLWTKILYFVTHLIDRSLKSYLRKSQKFLNIKYKWFKDRYTNYHKMKERVERSLQKFKQYTIFKTLDGSLQENFKKVYELLKFWLINEKTKALPPREPIRALRSAFSMDKAAHMFKVYHKALRGSLFERSKMLKKSSNELYDPASKRLVRDVVAGYRRELHTLGATIGRYRDFFLKTHPNPYVRTRWGFSEWVVGPEPMQTRELLHLMYEVENLDKLYEDLLASIEIGPSSEESLRLSEQYRDIQSTLHEMGQPLTSRPVMRSRAERFLEQVEEMNELGSSNPEVIDYVGKAFSKALRADWQYHVLFEIPLFHQLYKVHQGLVCPIDNRQHINRINKFNDLIKQLERWVKDRDTHKHVHEIELDMNDMKQYLQDFLAHVQRVAKSETIDKQVISDIAVQLLEYRYIFGKFFHTLHQHEPDGKLIRNQFLFVDQYFEAVENRLHEMRNK